MVKGFNNELYLKIQKEEIKKRIELFNSKLYLEFGGKLFDDYHASRVLPGFDPNSKIKILESFKDDVEVIFCINSKDIEKKKIRADYGITYDMELIRLINILKSMDIFVSSVVVTLYNGQPSIDKFRKVIENMGVKTYVHYKTLGYPTDIDTIVSEKGYGKNEFIKTTRKLVVVTAPGPSSGKLATCLSQLYHENKLGTIAGYAKYETFPVWNLSLRHPVNMAYEAATADLHDINMIDPFHLEAYGVSAVNYNRDIATFPILKNILEKIMKEDLYKSPTDMGVNMVGFCIDNNEAIIKASKEEIVRRYYNALVDEKLEKVNEETPQLIKVLMNELKIDSSIRPVIKACLDKNKLVNKGVVALKLDDSKIVTGKETELLSPASSMILNAIKELTNIPDDVYLLSPSVLKPILELKKQVSNESILNLHEVLIALSICSVTNPIIVTALENMKKLENCDAHSSYIIDSLEIKLLKSLKINITSEPVFSDN
ncbi:MAG: DUF1846 domain-containing protein [Bacilli bacterium]